MDSAIRVSFCTIVVHVSWEFKYIATVISNSVPLCAHPDLAGWQLDKLAENPKKQVEDVSDSDSDEDVPFACLICRKHYTDPIVTRCGHYFCSACAIKRFARTPKCAACNTPTGGIFNRADKIIEKINKKKKDKEDKEEADNEGSGEGGIEIEGLKAEDGDDDSDESD